MGVHWVVLLSALLACAESPLQEDAAPPPARQVSREDAPEVPAASAQAATSPPKWTDPVVVGHAVNGPMMQALLDGKEYEVFDPVTSAKRSLVHEQVQLDVPDQPDRVYPVSPSEGWVLVRARDRVEGTDVMLAYRLVWDTSQETISGDVGVFVAKEAVIVQVGEEEPRVTWTKAGVFWEKRAL